MKNKRLVTALLGTAFAGGLLVQALPVDAATVGGGSTGGSVGFSDHIVPPNPGTGKLQLLYIPKSFDFKNDNSNTTAAKTYAASNGQTKYAVVRDERTAAPTDEWKLTAKASTLVDGTDVLTGASYETTGNAVKQYVSASGANTEVPETAGAVVALPGSVTGPTFTAAQSWKADGTTTNVVAQGSDAAGTSKDKFALELNGISLKVPANTSKDGKQYKGKIDWSLEDAI